MRTVGLALVITSFVLVPPPGRLAAQTRVELDRVMSAEELSSTGLAKLSAEERRALELWLARYTSTVAVAARSLTADSGRPAPQVSASVLRLDRFPAEGGRIARTFDGGSFIEIEDGTIWEVYLPDRPRADDWESGEFVRIERLGASNRDFGFALVHGADRDRATARFAGWVRAGQASPPRRE